MERDKLLEKIKDTCFDIIVLAGQSNAEGNGLGNEELKYIPNDNAFELHDINCASYDETGGRVPVLKIVLPIEMDFSILEERKDSNNKSYASFAESFIKEYIDSGRLKKGRKVLLLRSAIGGTGFSRNEWGKDCVVYNRMKDMLDFALNANKNNRLVCFLWHQGEHDAFEQANLSPKERYNFYYEKFSQQVNDFISIYGDIPFIAGGFSPLIVKKSFKAHYAVKKATIKVLKGIKYGAFASSKGLKVNCQIVGGNDEYHFDRKSCIELGKRYFKLYKKLSK